MRNSALATPAVLLAALALAAAPAAAQTPVAGTYELVEVDGMPLPFTVDEEGAECVGRVTAGTLTLGEDGTWSVQLNETETCGENVSEETETAEGSYTVEGTSINFRPGEDVEPAAVQAEEPAAIEMEDLLSGTVEGERIRIQIRGTESVAVFQKKQG